MRKVISFVALFALVPQGAAQSLKTSPPDAPAPEAARQQNKTVTRQEDSAAATSAERAALLADLRALESDSKELLKPLDSAAAKAEIASAAWKLDRDWAKQLLRDALPLTFPEEAYRPKLREHTVGAQLTPGPVENMARGIVRSRILRIAAADPAFARELADTTARELGPVEEVGQYTQLAGAAAAEGRLDDAGDLIRKAIEAEPTLMDIGQAINAVAVRDRAAGDRLLLDYIDALRALPPSAFAEMGGAGTRVPLNFAMILRPGDYTFFGAPATAQPAGREAVLACINFVMDSMSRAEQAHADTRPMWPMLAMLWPYVAEQAPELAPQFSALERASRPPGAPSPALNTFAERKKSAEKRYEERVKTAKETKDPLDLEMAANSAMSRNDFDEARKLIEMLGDERLKAQLSEMADEKESLYLTGKGDTADAARLARQLTRPDSILRAYPPLVRRLAKERDAASAQFLTYEAVRLLKASAEKDAANDPYVPSLLAPVAGSITVFKKSRALRAMSELAVAVEPAGTQTALDVLDALAETANKARITSEQGNANFDAEAFSKLAAADAVRARAAASRFEDRLQRIVALASVCRGEAERLDKKNPATTSQAMKP
jgi:hypothetical protein